MTVSFKSILDNDDDEKKEPLLKVGAAESVADESVKILYDEYGGQLEEQHNSKMRVEPIDIFNDVPDENKHLVREAGQGGAVVGFVLGGPIGSALTGFGCAYSVRKNNSCGKLARKIGTITLDVKDKMSKFEERHHFYAKSKSTVDGFCENNRIANKTQQIVCAGYAKAQKFTEEHQLIEKSVEGTGKGIEFVGDTLNQIRTIVLGNASSVESSSTAAPETAVSKMSEKKQQQNTDLHLACK